MDKRNLIDSMSCKFSKNLWQDEASFSDFMRMPIAAWDFLLECVEPYICKSSLRVPDTRRICPGMRLAVTLRFLATGKYIYSSHQNAVMNAIICRWQLCKPPISFSDSRIIRQRNCPGNVWRLSTLPLPKVFIGEHYLFTIYLLQYNVYNM